MNRGLVLLVCAALGLAAARPANDFKSVLVAAQYQCDDALCPDWELDLARVNPSSPPIKAITKLSLLAPEAPVASMSYPVLTAYHDPSRTVFTVGLNVANGGTLWASSIDKAVTNVTRQTKVQFSLPQGLGTVSRVHSTANASLVLVFQSGQIASLDATSGKVTPLGTVLPAGLSSPRVTPASVVDPASGQLYTFIAVAGGKMMLSVYDLASGHLTSVSVKVRGTQFLFESIFHALWLPSEKSLVVFVEGGDKLGVDLIATVDPTTGAGQIVLPNLAEDNLFFMCDAKNKACDTLQTAAVDPVSGKVYFQATNIVGDDVGTTVIASLTINGKHAYTDITLTFTFGFQAFQMLPILA